MVKYMSSPQEALQRDIHALMERFRGMFACDAKAVLNWMAEQVDKRALVTGCDHPHFPDFPEVLLVGGPDSGPIDRRAV